MIILFTLLLLYGGLNLVEQNLDDLMGLNREAAAFSFVREDGTWKLTFSGTTLTISRERIQSFWSYLCARFPFLESFE